MLQGWRNVSLAARRVEVRRGCAPPALYVPDDLQLMSYLGQSTVNGDCVQRGEEREGEGERHNHSNNRAKKKKSELTLMKQMVPTETLYLVLLTLRNRAVLKV